MNDGKPSTRVRVTAAVIIQSGRVLLAQRGSGDRLAGMWEFPGGKIEDGETPEECLKRELKEELGIDTRVGEFLGASSWDYPHISIELLAYRAEIVKGTPTPTEHAACEWVTIIDLLSRNLAPADIPIAKIISQNI